MSASEQLADLGFVRVHVQEKIYDAVKSFFVLRHPESTVITTFAFDERGLKWKRKGHVDLRKHGFRDLTNFCDQMLAHIAPKH